MRFRTWTGVAATLAIATLAAQAQQPGTPAAGTPAGAPAVTPPPSSLARLEVRETAFNFGYVPQGYSISHTFWLKNAGSDTLRITDVRPG